MIQKATELGVTKFIPIIFHRTIVRKINNKRLEKIIIAATHAFFLLVEIDSFKLEISFL